MASERTLSVPANSLHFHQNSSQVTVVSLESDIHSSDVTRRNSSEVSDTWTSHVSEVKTQYNSDDEENNRHSDPEKASRPGDDFPPMDRGKDAYLVLAAAFILQGVVPGFPFAYGVFQDYYSTSPEFYPNNKTSIAAVGTSATGIFFFTAPFMYALYRRFPHWRKPLSILGAVIILAALLGASFANDVPSLLATQGIVYAIGGSLLFYPVFTYLDEWWQVRKGFAYGIVWAGACVSGIAIPFLMEWLLEAYGFRTALRTWAIITGVLLVPALCWLKPRLSQDQMPLDHERIDVGFLRKKTFWILQAGNMCVGLGYNMPLNYLPQFAEAVGFSTIVGTVALAVTNVGNIVGSTLIGLMVDRYHVTTAINTCVIGTLISVLVFWTFATSAPMLIIFSILYGAFAGGFTSTWAGCADPLRKRSPGTDTGMVVSMLQAGKGVGSLLSGPLSGALVDSDVWKAQHAPFVFGSGYGYLIVFTAITASLGLVGYLGKRAGWV